jgi:diguanylate cyclase (GGDEF)-like protein
MPMTGASMTTSGRIPCLARRLAPFAGAAVLAFALVVPGSDVRWAEYAAAALLTAAILVAAVALPWRRMPHWARVAPALLFLVAVFLLRDSVGASTAGIGMLAMLPVFWLAMHGTRPQLLTALGGVAAFYVLPVVLIGGSEYPLTQLRSAVTFVAVAGIIGLSVQRLYERVRDEAAASRRRERDLERVAAIARDLSSSADARAEICAAAVEISGAAFAVMLELDAENRLFSTASHGTDAGSMLIVPGSGPSAARLAFETRASQFITDPANDPNVSRPLWDFHGRPAGLLFEPVLRGGEAIGVLFVAWTDPVARGIAGPAVVVRLLAAEAASAIERSDLLARLADMAATDPLTGLPNRRILDAQLEHALRTAAGTGICVAMLDLDHFKRFNDVHGHQAGDRLLKEAAAAWRNHLRPGDVLSRWGGEEFAVLLPGCDADGARLVVERLRGGLPLAQTCSAGIAQWDGEESPGALLHRADTALYAAKRDGRDRISVA